MNASRSASLGQMLIVKLEESRWCAPLERLLDRYRPSGVYLSRLRDPGSTADLLFRIARALDAPPFLWLEEEGGPVDPLRACLPPLPSPGAVAERGRSAVERLGELVGAGMRLLGFNTDCAPLLDLLACDGGPMASRALASDPDDVARLGGAFMRGLARHQILACGKHFPGAGAEGADRSSRLPVVGKSMTELWREDLVPYRRLLGRLPLVMTGSAAYKAYDFDIPCPASESPTILKGLLRIKLRYDGLAVTDLARTAEVRDSRELGQRAARSVVAGCDLVIVPGREQSVEAAVASLASASDGAKLAGQVEQSLKRMRAARKQLPLPNGRISKGAVDQLARQFEDFSKATDRKPGRRSPTQTQEPKIA